MSASSTPDPTAMFPPRRPGTSVGQVFAFVAGFVALAAVGAAIGWSVTDPPKLKSNTAMTTRPPSTGMAQSPSPTPMPTTTPRATVSGIPLPDFHQLGVSFDVARAKLRLMGMGTTLIFNKQGNGVTVAYTDPAAGTILKRGDSVNIFVTGQAPPLKVPDVLGQDCNRGGKALAAAGFLPTYPDGRDGVVISTEPSADDTQTRWNDPIRVHCGVAGPTSDPSPSPSTTPPTVSPSPSASS